MGKNAQKLMMIPCVCAISLKLFGISWDIIQGVHGKLAFGSILSILGSVVDLVGMLLLTYWCVKTGTRSMLSIGTKILLAGSILDIINLLMGHSVFFFQIIIDTICLIVALFGIRKRKDMLIGFSLIGLGVSQWLYIYRILAFTGFSFMLRSIGAIISILSHIFTGIMFVALSYPIFRYGSNLGLIGSPRNEITLDSDIGSISARLDFLNAEYQAGRISFEEYKHRRMEILKTLGK